jgi:hypothetical protein
MSYIFFKKGIKRCCYWCFEEDKSKLSKDHLPPQSIFPKQERQGLQLITAPICHNCKKLHHISDDDNIFLRHMRFWASLSSGIDDASRRLKELIEYSSLSKGQEIVQAEDLQVELSTGEIIHYLILKGGKESILRVLDSIARAFHYRMRGEIIPTHISPDFKFKPEGSFNPSINLLTIMDPCVVKKQVFEFSPVLYEEAKFKYLCWEFKFYNLKPLPIYYSYYL